MTPGEAPSVPGLLSFSTFEILGWAELDVHAPRFYRSNKACLLNLLSPTEANLIFGDSSSQGHPWMVVIYKIVKKTDPAPDVTELYSAKALRGAEMFVWG